MGWWVIEVLFGPSVFLFLGGIVVGVVVGVLGYHILVVKHDW